MYIRLRFSYFVVLVEVLLLASWCLCAEMKLTDSGTYSLWLKLFIGSSALAFCLLGLRLNNWLAYFGIRADIVELRKRMVFFSLLSLAGSAVAMMAFLLSPHLTPNSFAWRMAAGVTIWGLSTSVYAWFWIYEMFQLSRAERSLTASVRIKPNIPKG